MAPHANFHQLISIEKLIVSVCRYHMSYIYADIICLISMQIYSLFFFYTMESKVYIKLNYFACSVGRHQQAESYLLASESRLSQPSPLFRGIFRWLNSLAIHHSLIRTVRRSKFDFRHPLFL